MTSDIRIDKEGVWYYQDAEMIRKDIVSLFARSLTLDEAGNYLIKLNEERCPVDVEDAPFVVRNASFVHTRERDFFSVVLSDESVEELDLESLRISDANILYCAVKSRRFTARFSRPAYYQMAEYIEHDATDDTYCITTNGRVYRLSHVALPGSPDNEGG